jgi:mannosyltransferase
MAYQSAANQSATNNSTANQSTESSPAGFALRSLCSPAFLLPFVAAAALRLLFLTRKPFWFDEAFSVEAARLDWTNFLHLLWWREANMSLYYLLLRGWLHLGQSEFFIRSLSVVAALATLPAIYWLGSILFDRRVGWIATALLACNAVHVRYAQEARSYALFILLATLSSGFFVAYLREPSRRNRLWYVVTSVLAVYAHFYALLLVLAHWLALRWGPGEPVAHEAGPSPSPRHEMRRALIWIGAAASPLLIFVAKTGAGPIHWIPRPGLRNLLDYYEHLAGNGGLILLALYAIACSAALAPVGKRFFALHKNASWEVWRLQFLLTWLLLPPVVTVLLSFARPVFLARYLVFCLPALILLVAAGLAHLRKMWMLGLALSVTLLLSLQGTLAYYNHDFDLERDGVGAATSYVLEHARPGDAVLFHIAETRAAYEFFRSLDSKNPATQDLGPEIVFPHHADRLDYRDFTGKPTSEFLRALPARYDRLWVVLMNNGPADNPDATTLMLNTALRESFPEMQQWHFPKVDVRLYSEP